MYNSESLESPSSPKSPPLLTMTNHVEGSMEVEQVGSPASGGGAMASDEGRQKRRKCLTPKECSCPVCGVTLRPREISTHFAQEVDKLVRLPQSRPLSQRTPILPASSPISVDLSLPSTSSSSSSEPSNCTSKRKERSHRKGTDWPKYERIRANRQARTRQRRRPGEADEGTEEGGTEGEGECPVCDKPFPLSELQRHIERCLRQAETEFEDDEVDVEGDGDEDGEYEEYEWCGVTRVRATSLLREGQLHAIGTKVKRGSEDEMVDVCDDDDNNFGPSQYRDEDLNHRNHYHHGEEEDHDAPPPPPHTSTSTSSPHAFSLCTSDTCGEHSSNMVSRVMSAGAIHNNATFSSAVDFGYGHSSGKGSSAANDDSISTPTSSSSTHNLSSNEHNKSSTLSAVVGNDPLLSSINDGDEPEGDVLRSLSAYSVGGGPVVEALRARVRQLEEDRHRGPYTCRVCHGEYEKPVVSVSCWHVHCETCWLQSLGAKKLCPQCSAITTASELRRVYL